MKDFSTLKVGDKIKSKVKNETLICVEFEGDKVLMRDPHPFPYGIPLFMLDAFNPNDWEKVSFSVWFKEYGDLYWLEPEDYYAESWKYLCTAKGEDGEFYDIVTKGQYPCELRFTTI